MINLENAYRYMGIPCSENVDGKTAQLAEKYGKELIASAKPKFIWRVFNIVKDGGIYLEGCDFALSGNSIEQHLAGCEKAAIVCSTLSADCDRFIAKAGIKGALEMLVCDALASAYIEQISDNAVNDLANKNAGYSASWVFGAGYGDFPLEVLPKLISAVDGTRKIGVTTTSANTLVPSKSIVGISGLSRSAPQTAKSCDNCNMRDNCKYRKQGKTCS